MKTFDDLGLAEPILRAISAEGFNHPTPIQSQAIPSLLKGKDIIGIAQTGTGKTAAFVLPLLHKLAKQKYKRAPRMCGALILSPTRELAAQIVNNIKTYSKYTNISVALIVGGVRPGNQIQMLNAGADIVVATTGRLLDHMKTGAIILSKTNSLIIDEADQMLDLGFLPDIRKIVERLPVNRQTALLSATMPNQIRKLANDLLTTPTEIKVAAVSRPVERISQSVRHVEKMDKRRILSEILSCPDVGRTIVFTRTKRGADRVCKYLKASNLNATAIHGDKSQGQRERAMDAFRSGATWILVATDIAARGIDVDDISHVVNFEIPNVPEAYVHRIGRTARAGRSGTAISLCDPTEKGLLVDIERLIGNQLTRDAGHQDSSIENRVHRSKSKSKKRNVAQNIKSSTKSLKRKPKKPVIKKCSQEQPSDGLVRMFSKIGVSHTKTAA